jgi:YesN/AraC family two-component response regulator
MSFLEALINEADSEVNEPNSKKYSDLYQNILSYFAQECPYINPDFSILQLAIALDTNSAYLSKAIKIQRNMNYNQFINLFRIEHVKEMIMQDTSNRYTLEYIYTSSGFKNHSTFNKVFKQIEGITPSEYYKKLEEKSGETDDWWTGHRSPV